MQTCHSNFISNTEEKNMYYKQATKDLGVRIKCLLFQILFNGIVRNQMLNLITIITYIHNLHRLFQDSYAITRVQKRLEV